MSPRRLAAGALAVVVVTGCFSPDELEPLPVPSSVSTLPTTTTSSVDHSTVPLAPVEGTTTTAAVTVGPGPATLAGWVEGPEGPVEGATVRLERLVGDAVATLEVLTGADGAWWAAGVLGGRYRVRAWRRPDLASTEAQVVFVAAAEPAEVILRVERFTVAVDLAVAPDPPVVGERTNVLVRITDRTVDADGVVRAVPRSGVGVSVTAGPGWVSESPLIGVTDEAGTVTFTLVCRAPNRQGLVVTLAPDQIVPLDPPECVVPAAPPPPATDPPATEG